jgi:hypothetical protein
MQELAGGVVGGFLLVELLFDGRKKSIKFSRLYHRPWNDLQFPRVKARDEVSVLLILNDLLEFESEPRFV